MTGTAGFISTNPGKAEARIVQLQGTIGGHADRHKDWFPRCRGPAARDEAWGPMYRVAVGTGNVGRQDVQTQHETRRQT